ncbi:hypothetical protein [Photobacterium leiognathi]|uniref:hypothetical protein n=1 Tax=Photobacterium leiognathi TaxID=553611 RepID=UPI000A647352|nr:hypothetical protein [Photobacterium leiognathi]
MKFINQICEISHKEIQFASLKTPHSVVTENVELRGVGHWVIRNQINEHLT